MKYSINILLICGLVAISFESSFGVHIKNNNADLVHRKEHEAKWAHSEEDGPTVRANELTQIGGKCYFLSTINRDNDGANTFCLNNKLRLASLVTKEDNDNVNTYLNAIKYQTTGSNHIWTSGHRFTCNPNMWYWQAINVPVAYTQWDAGEPNNVGGENCIELIHEKTDLVWNDYSCARQQRFLCEGDCKSA